MQAHIQAHIVEMFVRKLVIEEEDDIPDEAKPVVTALCKLYALNLITENSGDFLEVLKYIAPRRSKCLTKLFSWKQSVLNHRDISVHEL